MNADAVTMAEPTKQLFYTAVSELDQSGDQEECFALHDVESEMRDRYDSGVSTDRALYSRDPSSRRRRPKKRISEEQRNPVAWKIILGSKIREEHYSPKPSRADVIDARRASDITLGGSLTEDLLSGSKDIDRLDSLYRRKRKNWEFHRMVSYWSIMSYILGCSLFALACLLGSTVVLTHVESPEQESGGESGHRKYAFVAYPFCLGSLFFTIGGYIGWFRVLNSNYEGNARWVFLWSRHIHCATKEERIKILKAALYFMGGMCYLSQNLNKIIRGRKHSLGNIHSAAYQLQVVDFLIAASGLQLLGCCLEIRYLQNWNKFDFKNMNWWAVWVNLFVCACFFIGSVSGAFNIKNERKSAEWVNMPFLVGSIGMLIISWWYLVIFKQEQWMFHYDTHKGQFKCVEQFFVVVYIYNLLCCCCCAVYALDRRLRPDLTTLLFCVFGICMHLMLLHLTNVISALPENKAWKFMLMSLRVVVLIFSVPITLLFLSWYDPVKFDFDCVPAIGT